VPVLLVPCPLTGLSRGCILGTMKLTFALPDDLGRRCQAAYPGKEQSLVVASLPAKKLRGDSDQLAKARRGANQLTQVEEEMENWVMAG
jgi:hypothetical protein